MTGMFWTEIKKDELWESGNFSILKVGTTFDIYYRTVNGQEQLLAYGNLLKDAKSIANKIMDYGIIQYNQLTAKEKNAFTTIQRRKSGWSWGDKDE